MNKIALLVLAMLYTTASFAVANIVMPDLKMASVISNNAESNNMIQHSVTNSISKFSANIRGALIKTGNFRVVDALNESSENNYLLVGEINYIGENEDRYPIKDTNNIIKQYVVEVQADFKLIRVKDSVIMANFGVAGSGSDVKIVSSVNNSDTQLHHNIGVLVQKASIDLATNVVNEMNTQYNFMITNEIKLKAESVVIRDVKVYN